MDNTRLTELAFVAASVGSIYANPAATKSYVRGILLHNTNTTAETVALHWVPDSSAALGTAAVGNRFANVVLEANETLLFEVPFALVLLDQNESIMASTTTASKVTCAVIGDKES